MLILLSTMILSSKPDRLPSQLNENRSSASPGGKDRPPTSQSDISRVKYERQVDTLRARLLMALDPMLWFRRTYTAADGLGGNVRICILIAQVTRTNFTKIHQYSYRCHGSLCLRSEIWGLGNLDPKTIENDDNVFSIIQSNVDDSYTARGQGQQSEMISEKDH